MHSGPGTAHNRLLPPAFTIIIVYYGFLKAFLHYFCFLKILSSKSTVGEVLFYFIFFHLKHPQYVPYIFLPSPRTPVWSQGLPPSENPKFGQPSPIQRDASLQLAAAMAGPL